LGLSLRKAAKALGITHPALLKAHKEGRVTRESDGTYDVEQCRRQLAENSHGMKRRGARKAAMEAVTDPVTSGGEPESGNQTLAEAERQLKWEQVRKAQYENAVKEAQLVPLGEINAWVAGMVIRARDILTRIGPELKDRLAQETDPHKCERLIVGEVTRALNELAEFKATT
jgi:hypothetical protein